MKMASAVKISVKNKVIYRPTCNGIVVAVEHVSARTRLVSGAKKRADDGLLLKRKR